MSERQRERVSEQERETQKARGREKHCERAIPWGPECAPSIRGLVTEKERETERGESERVCVCV